jgi:diadenosine tetraphosphate (Ap4A) HIT family hydrolase
MTDLTDRLTQRPRVEQPPCFLCDVSTALGGAPREWFNQPLVSEPGVGAILAGVGALMPGYVLVAPAAHVTASTLLPAAARPGFLALFEHARATLARLDPVVSFFEHGLCGPPDRPRSACVEHAHLHLVPGRHDFATSGVPVSRHADLAAFLADGPRDRNYFMYSGGGDVVCAPDPCQSQYGRRRWAAALGVPERWDYALFPEWPAVTETFTLFATAG